MGHDADVRTRALLERAAVREQSSAAIFRARGHSGEARRAERFVSRIRLTLDEPLAAEQMLALARPLYRSPDPLALYERALDGALSLLNADFGNIQLLDTASGTSDLVAGSLPPAVGFRSVQSTPLIDDDGNLCGFISSYFRGTHRPTICQLRIMDWFADEVAAAALARRPAATTPGGEAAWLHDRVADRHEATASRHDRSAAALQTDRDDAAAVEKRDRASSARDRARTERARAEALRARLG